MPRELLTLERVREPVAADLAGLVLGEPVHGIAVSVDYWLPDGSYQLAARSRTGDVTALGILEVAGGRGTWTGTTSAANHPVAVTLADESGNVVCKAELVTS